MKTIHFKAKICKSYNQMGWSIGKSCGSSDIHKSIIDKKSISIFSKHTSIISISDHPFDTLVGHLITNVLVHVLGLTVLQELDSFQHGFREWEAIRIRRWNTKIGLRDWGLRNRIKQNSLNHRNFFLSFWWHMLVDFMIIIFGLKFSSRISILNNPNTILNHLIYIRLTV